MPQRTSDTQKSSPLSSKGGRKKYKTQKKETKEVGTELSPGKEVLKREKFPNTRKPSHCRICAKLWKHRGQHKRGKKINKQFKIADCEPYGNSPSGEAEQMPAPATSKRGLGREAWAAFLRLRIGPECPRG